MEQSDAQTPVSEWPWRQWIADHYTQVGRFDCDDATRASFISATLMYFGDLHDREDAGFE
ncbi:hypothetical protein CH252_33415 [Rhodococcus sp. 06-1477-1B]|uniref:hypothetical protein n=1 Tax=Rhodococcus sp. 06-1474-1B TaxID=2022499 RepID=UPI000B9AC895|nr:hypothetical protein [Rhodococcus sp. 06-1474-1B]OZD37387.1 hypothetical protein CH252_33415 [Rhodococcus sp. 06-1477-1B]OZD46275.1 hypothetical protein CH266_21660 [Rhodococcus sp. 06-1474-1B]